jgi:hypothetical protein
MMYRAFIIAFSRINLRSTTVKASFLNIHLEMRHTIEATPKG